MDLGLKGKIAIVTGASQGIGWACAAELLSEGAHVVVASIDPERNRLACDRLQERGPGRVLGVTADLSRPEAVAALFDKTTEEFGGLDILVNAAAIVGSEDFFGASEEAWTGLFEHKLNGTSRCIRHAVPLMRARGSGRIINVTGVAARLPTVRNISVALNNIAILNLTKAVAKAVAADGILVNAIVPGLAVSERNERVFRETADAAGKSLEAVIAERATALPLGRLGRPDEISSVVAFLASSRASFVTGSAWAVDGGVEATL